MQCLGQCSPLDYKSVGREEVNDGGIKLINICILHVYALKN